jgi:hypothetical protein
LLIGDAIKRPHPAVVISQWYRTIEQALPMVNPVGTIQPFQHVIVASHEFVFALLECRLVQLSGLVSQF